MFVCLCVTLIPEHNVRRWINSCSHKQHNAALRSQDASAQTSIAALCVLTRLSVAADQRRGRGGRWGGIKEVILWAAFGENERQTPTQSILSQPSHA